MIFLMGISIIKISSWKITMIRLVRGSHINLMNYMINPDTSKSLGMLMNGIMITKILLIKKENRSNLPWKRNFHKSLSKLKKGIENREMLLKVLVSTYSYKTTMRKDKESQRLALMKLLRISHYKKLDQLKVFGYWTNIAKMSEKFLGFMQKHNIWQRLAAKLSICPSFSRTQITFLGETLHNIKGTPMNSVFIQSHSWQREKEAKSALTVHNTKFKSAILVDSF